jgi:GTP-binding protein LepA
LANVYVAIDNDLEIVPVLNKIDLPAARPDEIKQEIEEVIGLEADDAVLCSAKTGVGVEDVLEAIVQRFSPPEGDPEGPLQALIFDSWFDTYRGVVALIRVVSGTLSKGDSVHMLATETVTDVQELGVFKPQATSVKSLRAGDVGFMITGIKEVRKTKIGDTVTSARKEQDVAALDGFQDVKPMVFSGLFPMDHTDYPGLRDALEKLRLNDAAFSFEPETSAALGFGFRCGFLGLLHMEIIQERLEREYGLSLITTAPTVVYKVETQRGETLEIDNPAKLPPVQEITAFLEPYVEVTVHVPADYIGAVLRLCEERRGTQKALNYSSTSRVMITYEMPFSEVIFDFFDKLKSHTRSYATLDYHQVGVRKGDLVKLDVRVNGD